MEVRVGNKGGKGLGGGASSLAGQKLLVVVGGHDINSVVD